MCTTYVSGVCGGQKRAQDALKMELWMAVNYYVDARNKTWVLSKSNKYP